MTVGKEAREGAARNHHPEAPPLAPSCSHVTDVDMRFSRGLPCEAHSYLVPQAQPHHPQVHPKPFWGPPLPPSSPLLGPGGPFCFLALPGCHSLLPLSLCFLIDETKGAAAASLGQKGGSRCKVPGTVPGTE